MFDGKRFFLDNRCLRFPHHVTNGTHMTFVLFRQRRPCRSIVFVAARCLCAVALLSGCASSPSAQTAATPTPRPVQAALDKPLYAVQTGTIIDQLDVTGNVAAVRQQDLSFTQTGYLKTLYAERTSVITQGQLLAELDLGELPNQLRQAQVAYEQAKLSLERDQAQRKFAVRRTQLDLDEARAHVAELQQPPLAAQVAPARAAVQAAQAALDQARINASATKSKASVQLEQASNALPLAQARYELALRDWSAVKDNQNDSNWQSRRDEYLSAQSDLRAAEAAVKQAQIEYDAARQNEAPVIREAEATVAEAQGHLDALRNEADGSEVAQARRAVQRAELAVEESQQGGDPELERRVATAQLDVERVQAQIDAGRLYAPFDGKIANLDTRPGQQIEAYKPVISVVNASDLEILIGTVLGEQATKIGVGMPVEITFTRYQGRAISGTLTRLPTSATSSGSSVNPDTHYHISYNAPDLQLDVGELAQVKITLARKENALWLPPQAVRAFEGRRFVVVKDGDRLRRQDVKVGITGADQVEILQGLNAGDLVVGQ